MQELAGPKTSSITDELTRAERMHSSYTEGSAMKGTLSRRRVDEMLGGVSDDGSQESTTL
jgi:hypothetical protein